MVAKKNAFNSHPPRAIFRTVNGKLTVREPNELEGMNSQIAELAHQLEQLELKVLAIQHQDRTECIKHFKALKFSVHNLKQVYNRLLWATTATAAALMVFFVGISLKSQVQTTSRPIQPIPASLNRSS